jgi:hypothetical protein
MDRVDHGEYDNLDDFRKIRPGRHSPGEFRRETIQ